MASKIIKQIKVKHSGEFLVDTVPPVGSLSINDGANFTKNSTVSLKLDAVDSTTDVKDMDIRNVDVSYSEVEGEVVESIMVHPFVENINFTNELFWNLTTDEGFKLVEVRFRDYAGNVTEFISNSSVRKLYVIEDIVIDAENIAGLIYTATSHSVYMFRSFNNLLNVFEGTVVDLQSNLGSLYVAVNNDDTTSQIYVYLDGEFISLNTFDSHIIDMASYGGNLYAILEDGKLYKKDSSAWFFVAEFSQEISYIDGEDDYLYIIIANATDAIIYNGEDFSEISIIDENLEVSEDASSSDSSSSNSSSSTNLQSSISIEDSSSSTFNMSTSSQTISTSSNSSIVQNSSSSSMSNSSLSLQSSSSEEFIGSDPSTSDEYSDESSDEYSTSTASESSSFIVDTSSELSSSSLIPDLQIGSSSSSGDPCDCDEYLEDSLYVHNFEINNMSDKYSLNCNFYGRLVTLNNEMARVYLYNSTDRIIQNEVARSIDFHFNTYPQIGVPIISSNSTMAYGSFDYISKYDRSEYLPHEFTLICVEGISSSSSSRSIISDSSESLDLMIGNGTEQLPYRIRTCADLQLVAQDPNAYYILEHDIDCIDTYTGTNPLVGLSAKWSGEFGAKGFSPIGTFSIPWAGNLDGKCHSIRNLYIDRSDEDYVGLFGYVDDAVIRNIRFSEFEIHGRNHVGGLVGYAKDTIISEASASVATKIDDDTMDFETITIVGNEQVGGLVGSLLLDSVIHNCYSNIVNVRGNISVGGLVGYRQTNSSIINSYSSETLSGVSGIGGLVGLSGSSGPSGGSPFGEVISSYWDVEKSGVTDSSGGSGKNTSEMYSQETYVGWNFGPEENSSIDPVWVISSSYPELFCNVFFDNSSSSSLSDVSEVSDGDQSSEGIIPSSIEEENSSSSQTDGVGIMARWEECILVAKYERCAPNSRYAECENVIIRSRYITCGTTGNAVGNTAVNKVDSVALSNAVYELCEDQGLY